MPFVSRRQSVREWDEKSGAVTRAFSEWKDVDTDIRSFMKTGLSLAREAYGLTWSQIAGPEPEDLEEDGSPQFPINNLNFKDWGHMFLSAVMRDALTAFEDYLGVALGEIKEIRPETGPNGERLKRKKDPRGLAELSQAFKSMGIDIGATEQFETIRILRNVFAHSRGRLERSSDRQALLPNAPDWEVIYELGEDSVSEYLEMLGNEVRRVDQILHVAMSSREPGHLV